jgi:hypothetical protein
MIKILAAVGFGSALMLAPALALADDAKPADAPKADATMAPAPMMHLIRTNCLSYCFRLIN